MAKDKKKLDEIKFIKAYGKPHDIRAINKRTKDLPAKPQDSKKLL